MDDFHNLHNSVKRINKDLQALENSSKSLAEDVINESETIESLENRIENLFSKLNVSPPLCHEDYSCFYINELLDSSFYKIENKTNSDKEFDLNKVDILVSCIAGGLSVLVDFLIVKIPKDMNIKLNGDKYHHEGSPLTTLLRKIGMTEDGKEAKWVKTLEKWFHVNYDPSIKENIPGMYPINHRVYSLGHDPSIIGLIWGIRDIVCGTFSYIDKNGVLHIDKVAPADVKKIFYAPILWLGHIISDLFTKQGIPIPGTCILRMFKVGSFGDKERTVGELIEYMYVQGYDLRHLATMSTCRLVIDVIINMYCFFVTNKNYTSAHPLFEQEYIKVKNEQKKRKLMLCAYSIAVAGNIGKVAAYQGNPFAFNAAIWYQFAREAISQFSIQTNDNKIYIDTIENRHLIDETFEKLLICSTQ